MPRFRLHRRRAVTWVVASVAVALIIALRFSPVRVDSFWGLFLLAFWMPQVLLRTAYLLLPGALWVVSGSQSPTAIPLGQAEWERRPGGWSIRWKEGLRQQSTFLPDPDGSFLAGLPASPVEGWPETVREVERAYPIGYGQVHFGWVPIFLLIAFDTQGLVLWLKEPHPIPLSHVKRISKGIATITVHTADIRHPVLRFNGYATSGLFIRRLQEYLKNRGG